VNALACFLRFGQRHDVRTVTYGTPT
jgi:hypothetical protein